MSTMTIKSAERLPLGDEADERPSLSTQPGETTTTNIPSATTTGAAAATTNDHGANNEPQEQQQQQRHGWPTTTSSTESLVDRSRIPPSMYMIGFCLLAFEWYGGIIPDGPAVAQSWWHSMSSSYVKAWQFMESLRDTMAIAFQSLFQNEQQRTESKTFDGWELLYSVVILGFVASIFIVLVWAPFRAGLWTGRRAAKKHTIHRYMGLFWIIQYAACWIEYVTDYEQSKKSYLPHFIALNGLIQAVSAYFSFRVLPKAEDPGFFSDKAILSRTFVHENGYFQLLTWAGAFMYHDGLRTKVQSHFISMLVQCAFVYWPFIVIRPFFPKTSMSKAGLSVKGRTKQNEFFYQVGTVMVKIFYLWGKFFLGIYINQLVFLGVYSDADMRFIRGLYILNMGTVSLPVFLHTLRFKKVLRPRLSFCIYLSQAYASFLALPYAWNLFSQHQRLCCLMLLGMALNFTRSLTLHGLWCAACLYLQQIAHVSF